MCIIIINKEIEQMNSQKLIEGHKQYIPVLFSYELLQISYTDKIDSQAHFLLETISDSKFKVIKNGSHFRQFIATLKRLAAQYPIIPVVYTCKNYQQIINIFINFDSSLKWTFIGRCSGQSSVKHQEKVLPNHCRLVENSAYDLIWYGDTYSETVGKEHLIMALKSVYDFRKQKLIVLEPNESERKRLEKQGYSSVFHAFISQQQILQIIAAIPKHDNQNQQVTIFIDQAITLKDLFSSKINLQTKKQHVLESIHSQITTSLNTKYYRLPSSNSICSYFFKGALASKYKMDFYAKCDLPKDIGGQLYVQHQQNKVLASAIYNVLQETISNNNKHLCQCMPMWIKKSGVIKYSSIGSYQKKRGDFIVRRFVKDCPRLSDSFKNKESVNQFLRNGQINGKNVIGLGSLFALSILTGQKFIQKGFFDQSSYYLLNNSYVVCRTGFKQLFQSSQKINNEQFQEKWLIVSCPQIYSSLKQMHPRFYEEMKLVYEQISRIYPLIEAVFKYHIWSHQKQIEMNIFTQNIQNLRKFINQIGTERALQEKNLDEIDIKSLKQITGLSKIDSRWINYLLEDPNKSYQENYRHFQKQDQQSGIYRTFEGFGNPAENPYVARARDSANFIIYSNGNMVPVFTLSKWMKNRINSGPSFSNLYKGTAQLQYISLLKHKHNRLEMKTKQAKIDKKNIFFIVDHCELDGYEQTNDTPSISDFCSGFKTVFIYRLRKNDSKKLKSLSDSINLNSPLLESQDQIFKTIFRLTHQTNKYLLYKEAIFSWIANKCQNYELSNLKAVDLLYKIVKSISFQKNRLVHFYSSIEAQDAKNLYALPIYISQQRFFLAHDIYEFLQADLLVQLILNGEDFIIVGDQLQHFKKFKEFFPSDLKQKIIIKLNNFLYKKVTSKFLKMNGSDEAYLDLCQVLRTLDVKIEGSLVEILRPQAVCASINEHKQGIICFSQGPDIILIKNQSVDDSSQKNKSSHQLLRIQLPRSQISEKQTKISKNLSMNRSTILLDSNWDATHKVLSFVRYNFMSDETDKVKIILDGSDFGDVSDLIDDDGRIWVVSNLGIYRLKTEEQQKYSVSQLYIKNKEDDFSGVKLLKIEENSLFCWTTADSGYLKIIQISQKEQNAPVYINVFNCTHRNIKCFNINVYQKQEQKYILLSCFHEKSDHLTVFKIPETQIYSNPPQGILKYEISDETHVRIYFKVEDNPSCVSLLKRTLWVGSEHGFIKKMQLPNIFDEIQ